MSQKPSQELLRELRRVVVPAPEPDEERERRDRVAARVLALSLELQAGQRRRVRLQLLLAAIVSLTAVVLVVRWAPWREQGVIASARILSGQLALWDGAERRPWTESTLDLSREPLIETSANEIVALELPSAAAVEVAAASELALSRKQARGGVSERIRLRAGGVKLRVPKLAPDQQLAVETADATVEVRGTRFAVRVEKDARGSFTRVDVEEGRVAVSSARGPAMVGAGERWTSREPVVEAAAPVPVPPVVTAPVPEVAPAPVVSKPRASASEPQPSAATASELAEQNRLLQGAALAKRSGLPKLALERLETLLDRYPTSELAHNARVEHFRLLRDSGQQELAQRSARAYLERYPGGFAANEAKGVLDAEEAR